MQNNFFFLRQLTRALDAKLTQSVISECYSQERAELIIRFETAGGSFHLRANLSPAFTCLSFPQDFQRARKNSVDLFQEIIGTRVVDFTQHENDRSFTLHLSHGYACIFKMHGNRSNIVLCLDNQVKDVFRRTIKADYDLRPAQLHRSIDWSRDAFDKHQEKLPSLYFTLGKIPWLFLQGIGFNTHSTDQRWQALQGMLKSLEQPEYYITRIDGALTFSLLPVGNVERQFSDPLVAVTAFSQLYRSREGFESEQTRITALLRKRIAQAGDAWQRALSRLDALTAHDKFKEWADLLMANLHLTPEGDRILVPNFYRNNEPETIRLQRDLTLQKNAAVYYGKSKKQQIEMRHLENLISQKEQELASLRDDLASVEGIKDLKTLRTFAGKYPPPASSDETESVPYHEQQMMGFRILIGRNAQANDELLQRFGYKDDLWLHAKDVPGSHVLIKHQAGKSFPKPVIEHAAQLAAWYSKRKTDTLCPVSVTPRKYVRKRKGDPAGAVVVERETVILVKPDNSGMDSL